MKVTLTKRKRSQNRRYSFTQKMFHLILADRAPASVYRDTRGSKGLKVLVPDLLYAVSNGLANDVAEH